MATNDATIVKIKHEILEEVAKLVFAGKFEEEKHELPLRLMPGQLQNIVAASIKNGKLCGSVCGWQRVKT